MSKQHSDLYFIDRSNYTQLLDKKFKLSDLHTLLKSLHTNQVTLPQSSGKVSPLTINHLATLNNHLHYTLFDYRYKMYTSIAPTCEERNYLEHAVVSYLTGDRGEDSREVASYNDSSIFQEPEKYCEIVPLVSSDARDLLAIVEEGFFTKLTKSKEELQAFFLTCLSHQYSSGVQIEPLLKRYLSIKVNESNFDLIKTRFDSELS